MQGKAFWQDESYDPLVRSDGEFERIWAIRISCPQRLTGAYSVFILALMGMYVSRPDSVVDADALFRNFRTGRTF